MMAEQACFDICIVCALYEEARAVLDEFSARCGVTFATGFRRTTHLEYRHATIQNGRGEPLSVFVTWLPRMGPIRTALDLVPLLQDIRPRFVAMAGICAGDRSRVALGDLIVATHAYHPEEGKTAIGPDERPVHWPEPSMAGMTTQVLQYVQSCEQWQTPVGDLARQWLFQTGDALGEPVCHLGVMASGLAVRADDPFATLSTH